MARSTRSKVTLVAAVFGAILLLLILYASLGLGQYTCQVCVEFNGRQKCRSAAGPTREEAQRTATDNACSFLASGMTESIRCTQTLPVSVKCRP